MKVPGKRVVFAAAAFATCAAFCAVTGGCRGKGQPAARNASVTADSAGITVVVAEVHEQPFEDWGSYSAELRGIEDARSRRRLRAVASTGSRRWGLDAGPATPCAGSTVSDTKRPSRRQRPRWT